MRYSFELIIGMVFIGLIFYNSIRYKNKIKFDTLCIAWDHRSKIKRITGIVSVPLSINHEQLHPVHLSHVRILGRAVFLGLHIRVPVHSVTMVQIAKVSHVKIENKFSNLNITQPFLQITSLQPICKIDAGSSEQ